MFKDAPSDAYIDKLIERITRDNLHVETDAGSALGREVLDDLELERQLIVLLGESNAYRLLHPSARGEA